MASIHGNVGNRLLFLSVFSAVNFYYLNDIYEHVIWHGYTICYILWYVYEHVIRQGYIRCWQKINAICYMQSFEIIFNNFNNNTSDITFDGQHFS